MIPQFIHIGMNLIGLFIILKSHGKPRTGRVNAWNQVPAIILVQLLLYYGGFYDGFFK